jgi:YesN/AraC family two-component response regulator
MQLRSDDLQKAHLVKALIDKEYYKQYTYEDLVYLYGTNKFKLKFAFRAIVNDSIYEYHTKVRIERAKELLETSELSVEQIARKIGIDKSNLCKQFKRLTGKTPTEWRSANGQWAIGNWQ